MRVRLYLLILLLLSLPACTQRHVTDAAAEALESARFKANFEVHRKSSWTLHQDTRVLLHSTLSDDSEMTRYRNQLDWALKTALVQSFPSSNYLYKSMKLEQALTVAAEQNHHVLLVPRLLSTANPRNSWQEVLEGEALHPQREFGLDRLVLQVLCYDVHSRRLIDITTVSARGPLFASTDHVPTDLLEDAASRYIDAIGGY